MLNRSISVGYAKALFNLDKNKKALEKRLLDFEFIVKIFKENSKIVKFLKAPHIDVKEKNKILIAVFNDKIDTQFMNFLKFLIQERRIISLYGIAKEYRRLVNDYLGIWDVNIVTAVPIDEENEISLKEKLSKKFQKKIILSKKVNPKLIGGLTLIMGNVMLDWTLTCRLKKLKENL